MSGTPGSIVSTGYNSSNTDDRLGTSGDSEDSKSGSERRFFIFIALICACGISLILLAIFLWRKYTRAPSCDNLFLASTTNQQQKLQNIQNQQQYEAEAYRQQQLQQQQLQQQQQQQQQQLGVGYGGNPVGGGSKAPCLNCRLIQMGSAISYGDNRCPQCGESCG